MEDRKPIMCISCCQIGTHSYGCPCKDAPTHMELKENRPMEERIKEFIDSMPYCVGSGKSQNDLMLEAVRFGQSLSEEEIHLLKVERDSAKAEQKRQFEEDQRVIDILKQDLAMRTNAYHQAEGALIAEVSRLECKVKDYREGIISMLEGLIEFVKTEPEVYVRKIQEMRKIENALKEIIAERDQENKIKG